MSLSTRRTRSRSALRTLGGLLVLLGGAAAMLCQAADHRDGPIFVNTAVNGRMDLNDIFIFQSPVTPTHTVMIMTLSPFPGVLTPTTFDQRLVFEFKIDNDGDAVEDLTFRVTFGAPDDNGVQHVTLRVIPGKGFPHHGILAEGQTGQTLDVKGGGQFLASNFDDPFFFDAGAFATLVKDGKGGFPRSPGQARNFFGPNANTLGIVLEIPTKRLLAHKDGEGDDDGHRNPNIGVWIRSVLNGKQLDRMGRPAINTALIPPVPRNDLSRGERRNAFNAGQPKNDRRDFRADMIYVLTSPKFVYQRTPADAAALADFLLPDILTIDTSIPFNDPRNGFPNGRRLRDPVIHTELNLLTNGAVTTDNVDDDNGTRITDGNMGTTAAFPYIGPPNSPPAGPNP